MDSDGIKKITDERKEILRKFAYADDLGVPENLSQEEIGGMELQLIKELNSSFESVLTHFMIAGLKIQRRNISDRTEGLKNAVQAYQSVLNMTHALTSCAELMTDIFEENGYSLSENGEEAVRSVPIN